MGLGKTLQCAAFIAGMLRSKLARRVMVVAPKTLLAQWNKELGICGIGTLAREFAGSSEGERQAALRGVARGPGVLLTTYGMVLHNAAQLAAPQGTGGGGFFKRGGSGGDDDDFQWDFIIMDEGHKVKNPRMKLVQVGGCHLVGGKACVAERVGVVVQVLLRAAVP